MCVRPTGKVSAHVPSTVCPVHVLWPWVVSNCPVGSRVFPEDFPGRALQWLRVALEARGVEGADSYGLRSTRRGAARKLVDRGGDLATLLKAGGWKSAAFRSYLDLGGVEGAVCQVGLSALLNEDEVTP